MYNHNLWARHKWRRSVLRLCKERLCVLSGNHRVSTSLQEM
jgi:hypothetical protein